jgi:hypothetical protein
MFNLSLSPWPMAFICFLGGLTTGIFLMLLDPVGVSAAFERLTRFVEPGFFSEKFGRLSRRLPFING